MILNKHFDRYIAQNYKSMLAVERVKQLFEANPFHVLKVFGDTATQELLHALENSSLTANSLHLAAEVMIKYISSTLK